MNLYHKEKDAIAFLGLMAIAYKNFDEQFLHADTIATHTKGLNIYAAILDNTDGELLACRRNTIHSECNPLLHAEQATLRMAIAAVNKKNPRNIARDSVETYYRSRMFNDPAQHGNLNIGGTIYTTLEPCPYCTSALLVSRMKRIVYIVPDVTFGDSFTYLKQKFYPAYDMVYEQISFSDYNQSELIVYAGEALKKLLDFVAANPKMYGTLILDHFKPLMREAHDYFLSLTNSSLITQGSEKANNLKTISNFIKAITGEPI